MPPKIKHTPACFSKGKYREDKKVVTTISKKIKDFINKNKLAVASSATATAALAITIGYVLASTGGHNYMEGHSNAIINETNKFISNNGQELINYFTQMGSNNMSVINKFVQATLNSMGDLYYDISFRGGNLSEEPSSFTSRVKKTMKSVGKSIYDAVISETGQELGKAALITLILAGIAYGFGPRAATLATSIIGSVRPSSNNTDIMSEDEQLYWQTVERIIQSKPPASNESRALSSIRSQRFPNHGMYHRNHPEMMPAIIARAGRGLKSKGGNVTEYIKDKASKAHKFIMSKEGMTLGKTALSALILAAISKGVTDIASSEMYDYADKPARERAALQQYKENRSVRSAARWANEHRKPDNYFNDSEIRL
jgi:hypothetical protein